VVGWILSELPDGEPFRGRFNEIVGHMGHKLTIKGYEDAVEEEVVAREYERWLTKFG
jgi:hypothetical protein